MNGDLSTSCNLSNCDCDKPKPMTDQRARAEMNELELRARKIANELVVLGGAARESYILTALADERRRVWEEAKLIADTVAAKHPAPEDWMARLAALSISNLMDAKAHAGQEG